MWEIEIDRGREWEREGEREGEKLLFKLRKIDATRDGYQEHYYGDRVETTAWLHICA